MRGCQWCMDSKPKSFVVRETVEEHIVLVMGSSGGDGRQFNCDTINIQYKKWKVDRKYCSGRVLERVGLERCMRLNRRQTRTRWCCGCRLSWLTRVTEQGHTCRRRRTGTTSSTVTYARGTSSRCFRIKRMISSKVSSLSLRSALGMPRENSRISLWTCTISLDLA